MVERPVVEYAPTVFRIERWYGDHWEPVAATFWLHVAVARFDLEVRRPGHVLPVCLRATRPEGNVVMMVWRLLDHAEYSSHYWEHRS